MDMHGHRNDTDMEMDVAIDRFGCQISRIGKKSSLIFVSFPWTSIRYQKVWYEAQSDIVHHGYRDECTLMPSRSNSSSMTTTLKV
jgi:hypothetical protein